MNKISLSNNSIVFVLAGAAALFALSVIFSAVDVDNTPCIEKHQPNSYSTSLIGHAGLYEMLRLMGKPVKRAWSNSAGIAGPTGTLLLIEPEEYILYDIEDLAVPRLLLVLPKWEGTPMLLNEKWVSSSQMLALSNAQEVLDIFDVESLVLRCPWPNNWLNNSFSKPSGSGDIQLIESQSMRPLIESSEGILLGEINSGNNVIWVLADPDIISNQGLAKGSNSNLAVEIIERLYKYNNNDLKGSIVFDEETHNAVSRHKSFLNMLFSFPYFLVTIFTAVSVVMMVLAGAGRFGKAATPKPEIDFGKKQLIDNSVRLLDFAGHHGELLNNYIWMIVRLVAREVHAPKGQGDRALLQYLDKLGRSRGVKINCSEIINAANVNVSDPKNSERLYLCARDIHYWKGEILYGPKPSKRHS